MSAPSSPPVANHHADHPGFTGLGGLVAALTMTIGRGAGGRLAADLTGITAQDRVVDVGCGPGTAVRVAARRGAKATGVDPAAVMLRVARRLTHGTSLITWTAGTAEALPLPDQSATVLWSLATVHHWADIEAGLGEAQRVLQARGRLLAIERRVRPGATGHASHGWTEEQAEAFAGACRAAAFTDVRVETHREGGTSVFAVRATKP